MPDRRRKFDWKAVGDYYAAGHTAQQCQTQFGLSNGAWYSAVQRGDINLRVDGRAKPRGQTRKAVQALLDEGLSQGEIARRLSVSKPTVSFHMRRLGIPPKSPPTRRYDWEEIREYYEQGHSAAECQRQFGFSGDAWADAVARGKVTLRPRLEPLETVLAAGRHRSRGHVKLRLLMAGLKEPRCETCGLTEWRAQPLSLELHHINGDGLDNRLENLLFLCPNCHSQTNTWGGRKKAGRPAA